MIALTGVMESWHLSWRELEEWTDEQLNEFLWSFALIQADRDAAMRTAERANKQSKSIPYADYAAMARKAGKVTTIRGD